MELFYGTGGGGKAKENDRASTILKYIISVRVDDIMKYIKKLLNNGGWERRGKGE
jgi:hypothetical protein